jgi:DNA-binding transcriptional regulator YiaG
VEIEDATAPAKHRKTSPHKTVHGSNKRKPDRKTAAGSRKPVAVKTTAVLREKKFPATGAAIARLRKQLEMTRAQFAKLIGVSPQTVTNWESKRGKLRLQERTLKTLTRVWLRKQS